MVILPAFGASLEEMQYLDGKGVTTVDTTCPWVSKVRGMGVGVGVGVGLGLGLGLAHCMAVGLQGVKPLAPNLPPTLSRALA